MLLLPLFGIEALLRWLVSRRQPRFEQELARLAHAVSAAPPGPGRERELVELIQSQHLLRFAAGRGYLQAKLAAVYRQFGQHRRAADAFREALDDAPAAAAFPLALGLADSLYELGLDAEAERFYRRALDEQHAPPRACAHMARLIRRRRGPLDEAEAYLRRAVEQQPEPRWRCELAALLAERGRVDEADWHLRLCDELLADAVDPEAKQQLAAARQALERARTAPTAEPDPAPRRQ